MRKLYLYALVLGLTFCGVGGSVLYGTNYAQAESTEDIEYKSLEPMYVTSMKNLSWGSYMESDTIVFDSDNPEPDSNIHYKFYLSNDSQIHIQANMKYPNLSGSGNIVLDGNTVIGNINSSQSIDLLLQNGEHTLTLDFNNQYDGRYDYSEISYTIGVAVMAYRDPFNTSDVNLKLGKTSGAVALTYKDSEAKFSFSTDKKAKIKSNILFESVSGTGTADVYLYDSNSGNVIASGTARHNSKLTLKTSKEYASGDYYIVVETKSGVTGYVSCNYTLESTEKEETTTPTKPVKKKKQLNMPLIKSINLKTKKLKGTGVSGATIHLKYNKKTYTKTIKSGKWTIKLKGKITNNSKVKVWQTKSGYKKSNTKSYTVHIRNK